MVTETQTEREGIVQDITKQADAIIAERGILQNTYFTALVDGSMDLHAFRASQQQFYWAVDFFSRPMAALVARIPDATKRLDILHNVVEEHGDFTQARFHTTTFRQFLRSIGAQDEAVSELKLRPEVRMFNSSLTAACLHDEVEVGIAAMGIIEYAFADISQIIGQGVVNRGWVAADELVHYKLHAQIDKRHAQEFFEVVTDQWQNPERRYYVEQGLQLGVFIFDVLYRELGRVHL